MRHSLALLPLLALAACGGGMNMASSGDMGVTPGGSQDLAYARDVIENGMIPTDGTFYAEGLFSEHDLPLDGEACEATLCPRAAAAHIDPVDGSGGQLLVQLGFASELTEIQRPTLDLAVAIDISCSMSGEKLETSQASLLKLIDELEADDQLSLITYGTTAVVVAETTPMDETGKETLRAAVRALATAGSTAMEEGLRGAIEEIERSRRAEVASQRVFLLTDAQPNVGADGIGDFVRIASDAADSAIGVTVWGVGLDLGAELVGEMSKLRGGNAYHFTDMFTMVERVGEEFDFMVTPLAYDLEVQGVALQGLAVADTYGAPTDPLGDVAFGAATLFPSNRAGGMGVTLTWEDGSEVLESPELGDLLTLSASWVEADTNEVVQGQVTVTWQGGDAHADTWTRADDDGVFTMGALIDEYKALQAGAEFCNGSLTGPTAEARVQDAATRLATRAPDWPALAVEAELMTALLVNLRGGEANCL